MLKTQVRIVTDIGGKPEITDIGGQYNATLCMFFKETEDGGYDCYRTSANEDIDEPVLAALFAQGFMSEITRIFANNPARVRQVGEMVGEGLKKASRQMIIQRAMREQDGR